MVFKTYLKLIPSYIGVTVMYVAIFSVLLIMTVSLRSGDGSAGGISGFTVTLAINDLDGSEESRIFSDYLKNSPNIKTADIDFDSESAVQDSLYYRKADYVLTINEGFAAALADKGAENLVSSQVIAGSASEVFAENCIDSFIAAARLYTVGGYDTKTACEEAARVLESGVQVSEFSVDGGFDDDKDRGAYLFFNFMPYIMLMMMLSVLVPTFSTFLDNEVKSRSFCAPISPSRYMTEIICGAFIISATVAAVLLAVGMLASGGNLFSKRCIYTLLQTLVYLLFCLSLSALVGVICSGSGKKGNYIVSMVSNVLGLGMSFLCGVFVSQSLLGENILAVAKFLPVYWYVKANNAIYGADGAVFDEKTVLSDIMIQALFVLALFAATLLAAHIKKGRESR